MIYVAGGTVHTLGPGSVIVETQQQSDTTYRLYDYGRPRELHLKDGMAAVKENVTSGKVLRPAPQQMRWQESAFTVGRALRILSWTCLRRRNRWSLATRDDSGKSSVQILVAVEGCGVIEAAGMEPVTLAKGDAVVVPACVEQVRRASAVGAGIPAGVRAGKALPEPETRM